MVWYYTVWAGMAHGMVHGMLVGMVVDGMVQRAWCCLSTARLVHDWCMVRCVWYGAWY